MLGKSSVRGNAMRSGAVDGVEDGVLDLANEERIRTMRDPTCDLVLDHAGKASRVDPGLAREVPFAVIVVAERRRDLGKPLIDVRHGRP